MSLLLLLLLAASFAAQCLGISKPAPAPFAGVPRPIRLGYKGPIRMWDYGAKDTGKPSSPELREKFGI